MKHIEFTHVFICEICKEWDGGIEYRGEDEFARHNQFIHADCDKTLKDEEFSLMITVQREEIEYGPETPRREDLLNKIKEEEKKKQEEERRQKEEEKTRREEERRKKEEERRKKEEEKTLK